MGPHGHWLERDWAAGAEAMTVSVTAEWPSVEQDAATAVSRASDLEAGQVLGRRLGYSEGLIAHSGPRLEVAHISSWSFLMESVARARIRQHA
jgi:hypothetical protein